MTSRSPVDGRVSQTAGHSQGQDLHSLKPGAAHAYHRVSGVIHRLYVQTMEIFLCPTRFFRLQTRVMSRSQRAGRREGPCARRGRRLRLVGRRGVCASGRRWSWGEWPHPSSCRQQCSVPLALSQPCKLTLSLMFRTGMFPVHTPPNQWDLPGTAALGP